MINLPRKEESIVIDLEDEDYPDLKVRMRTLQDSEAAKLLGGRVRSVSLSDDEESPASIEISMAYDDMMKLFAAKFVEFVGDEVCIANETFDIKKAHHRHSLPLSWKSTVMGELVRYASSIDEDLLKNSNQQDGQSPEDSTTPPENSQIEGIASSVVSSG